MALTTSQTSVWKELSISEMKSQTKVFVWDNGWIGITAITQTPIITLHQFGIS